MSNSFSINVADLQFILTQIKIAEAHAAGTPLIEQIVNPLLPWGLRTVDGSYNNFLPGREHWGAADTVMPRMLDGSFVNAGDEPFADLNGPLLGNGYTGNYANPGNIVDSDPRTISNLIVDMSVNNPAAVEAWFNNELAVAAFEEAHPGMAPIRPGVTPVGNQLVITNEDLALIPNIAPDEGLSAGFNAWMTFFGQFFDHGLDLIAKGNNGTIFIPLQPDDPLITHGPDGVAGTGDEVTNPAQQFMVLTRATPAVSGPGADGVEGTADDVSETINTTTSWVDQNQTYTSHASHQLFLREYKMVDGKPVATGHLLDGTNPDGSSGGMPTWADIKDQARDLLGIQLTDMDVLNIPLFRTDPYGEFIRGANGLPLLVLGIGGDGVPNTADDVVIEGDLTSPINPATATNGVLTGAVRIGHAFLDDIAHNAVPFGDLDGNPDTPERGFLTPDSDTVPGPVANPDYNPALPEGPGNTAFFTQATGSYDDELLNNHFITGDGRGNENIGLSTVHHIFHSEHNRLVEQNKATLLQSGDVAFLNEWLVTDVATIPTTAEAVAALNWDGERLFQAARFGTEMQYQHLVFEEFARKIQPNVDLFVFNNSPDIDPTIFAEFAHTVYRFGHSMLTETIRRTNPDGSINDVSLIDAFLNPLEFFNNGAAAGEYTADQAAGAIVRGMTNEHGNSIDEFVTSALRNNLLGLPLDLPAINIARGRDTGVPTLNETREQLYVASSSTFLKPYDSWADFAANLKNPASVANFIAAYGQHDTILLADDLAEKRAAATAIVLGGPDAPPDRMAFLHSTGSWNAANSGLNSIDLWIGGLAEKIMPFGGMLGSTFNAVFELQMENLQDGDRLYYLTRTQGMNLLTSLENNSFAKLMMRNTDMAQPGPDGIRGTQDDIIERHIGVDSFADYDYVLEVNKAHQTGDDPVGNDPYLEAIGLNKVLRDNPATALDESLADTSADQSGTTGHYIRYTGGEHVVFGGTNGNDTIIADYGDDGIWGDAGDDTIEAGAGVDLVNGGAGDDVITDSGDTGDFLKGDDGNDVIANSNGLDILMGGDGQDLFLVGVDETEVFGGAGNDFILGGEAADFLMGGEGDDWIEGGPGFDVISGENSELFFNSPIIGHDVLIGGGGGDMDYDAESGDDIMLQDETVTRNEGMNGFDWAIHKDDPFGANSDLQIPIFTTVVNDILRDRFDAVEGLSGWKLDDILRGDDRGHSGGSSSPDSVPVELFIDHTLDQAGIARIAGLNNLLNGSSNATIANFKNGNILLGGDGNDQVQGRGGFDIIDGDAWLNVRIRVNDTNGNWIGSAESLGGPIFATNAAGVLSPLVGGQPPMLYGGRLLSELGLDRTINPGQLAIVREIKYDDTNVTGANKNIDTAIFQGGDLEYEIEGTRIIYDATTGEALRRVNSTGPESAPLNIRDANGDGFITVRDLDDGTVAAPGRVGGLTVSRGALTDDTDQLVNIERLQFADKTLSVGLNAPNRIATGTVTISDPSPFDHDGNPATPGVVSPIVGQVLTATLSNLVDPDGVTLDSNGNPIGLTFEWQTTEAGNDGGWATISSGLTYTVRPVDPAHVLRAVAVFTDNAGVPERIASPQTDNVSAPFSVNENSPTGTVVAATIPFSLDYDPLGFGGTGVTDGDVIQLTHVISAEHDAGGRFTIVNVGTAAAPIYQLQVANGGPQMLNYEAGVHTPANQSHQFVDNEYQIVVETYTDTIANGGELIAARQFTIFLNDVTGEVVNIAPVLDLQGALTTTPGNYREEFSTQSYTGTDSAGATVAWTTSWTEGGGEGGGATGGDIEIIGNRLRFDENITGGENITRTVDLTGATSATLSFTWEEDDRDPGEQSWLVVAASGDILISTALIQRPGQDALDS